MLAKLILRLVALIYVVRFAAPALMSASQAQVFGNPWMAEGNVATALLDSDIRHWGVICLTFGFALLLFSGDPKRHLVILDVAMMGVLLGAVVRTAEIALGAELPTPALIATGVEWLFPLAWFIASAAIRREKRFGVTESRLIDAPRAAVWGVFADYANVHEWHPYMEAGSLDAGSPERGVGAVRSCSFGPKMAIRETVKEWSDEGASMTIAIDFLKGLAPPIEDVLASVRVEELGDRQARLVLSMSYRAKLGPVGGILSELFILAQYRGVFDHMLAAAKARAETGGTVPQVVMPMSGRVLAS